MIKNAKRFWKDVSIDEVEGGYAIRLDGRPVKTPLKSDLVLPTRAMAEAVAAEWDAVDEIIKPLEMHYTRCANATIDRVTREFAAVADMLGAYGETDLLCHRAAQPEALAAEQAENWDPVLAWLAERFDAPLSVTAGILAAVQPDDSLTHLRARIDAFTPWQLSAFHDLVTLSGSLVLGLAVAEGFLSGEDAWNRSRIDENWQERQWGVDEEAAQSAAAKKAEFLRAVRLLELLG